MVIHAHFACPHGALNSWNAAKCDKEKDILPSIEHGTWCDVEIQEDKLETSRSVTQPSSSTFKQDFERSLAPSPDPSYSQS